MKTLFTFLLTAISCAAAQLYFPATIPASYPYQPETLAYQSAITANGGTISAGDLQSVDGFVSTIKAAGFESSVMEFCPMAGNNTNAAVVKLFTYPGAPTNLTLVNMTSGYYSKGVGWSNSQDASLRYLTTGMNVSGLTNALPGVGVYVTSWQSAQVLGNNMLMAQHTGPPYFDLFFSGTTATAYFGTSGPFFYCGTPSLAHGFYGANQDDATDQSIRSGLDSIATLGSQSFSMAGNNNPLCVLGDSTSGNQYPGAIGCYGIWNGLNTAQLQTLSKAMTSLMVNLGRETPPTNVVWVFPVTGQSLSTATGSTTNLSSQVWGFNNFTFADGPLNPDTQMATVGGSQGMFRLEESGLVETISAASMAELASLGSSNVDLFSGVSGYGGASYATIAPGSVTFANCLGMITNCQNYTGTYFASAVCPAMFVIHGETDSANTNYQADLMQWVSALGTNAPAITGQTNHPVMFHSQIAQQPNLYYSASDLAMFNETRKIGASNILVCPKYFLQGLTNNQPHYDAHSYQRLAEYYGEAFYQWNQNGKQTGVWPFYTVRTNQYVWCFLTNVVGTLTLDSNTVPLVGPTFGFTFYTNIVATNNFWGIPQGNAYVNQSQQIDSVSIIDTNEVLIVLHAAPTTLGPNYLNYALWDSGLTNQYLLGTNQLRGNVRDSNPRTGYLSTSNLWHWVCNFSVTNGL